MSSLFIKTGNSYRVKHKEDMVFSEVLPPGTYSVKIDCAGYYLDVIEDMKLPPKLYGNTLKNADRILRTFQDRPSGTGVLLSGEKGSGKTLLAKVVSAQALQLGIITIVINMAECAGEAFNGFISMITQPAVILFDEFEKTYSNNKGQEKMLTLLDGVYPSKKLFLLTCNEKHKLNTNLLDRPGRLFYLLEFEGLGLDFVKAYCEDNLVQTKYVDQVCTMSGLFRRFNFDMLKALVEEMNRYEESPSEAIKFLNARPDFGRGNEEFVVAIYLNGEKLDNKKASYQPVFRGDIFGHPVCISYQQPAPETKKVQEGEEEKKSTDGDTSLTKRVVLRFTGRDLEKVNTRKGIYEYQNDEMHPGVRLILTRKRSSVGFLDLDKFCSLDTPAGPDDLEAQDGAAGDGQVMDVMHIDEGYGDY